MSHFAKKARRHFCLSVIFFNHRPWSLTESAQKNPNPILELIQDTLLAHGGFESCPLVLSFGRFRVQRVVIDWFLSTAITVFFLLFQTSYYLSMSSFTGFALYSATIIKRKSCKISLHLTRWIYCCHKNKGPQGSLRPMYWRHRVQAWGIYCSTPLCHCTYLKTWLSWHWKPLLKKMQPKGKEPGMFDLSKEKCALLCSQKAS